MKAARLILLVTLAACVAASPTQGFDLLDKAKQKLKDKGNQKTDQAMDRALDSAEQAATPGAKPATKPGEAAAAGGAGTAGEPAAADQADQLKPGQGAWANYDFKPGERVLFADDFRGDEVGDFPRRLEFVQGAMELVEWQGKRWLRLTTTSKFDVPLPEVLPSRYTLEFDFSVPGGEMWIYPDHETDEYLYVIFGNGGIGGATSKGVTTRSNHIDALADQVVRGRVMADGAYIKVYVNDRRVLNIPNFGPQRSNKLRFYVDAGEDRPAMFGDFRIAAGGKKLYDALSTAGRVATQGIYFDTGSDRIRPESTPTLKEIAAMLAEHPELKLLIEGHTDNVGAAAANQALSEKRAAAVRQSLIDGFGVDGARLTTRGLGATKPVGPNDTPEGRQNNRRVELVKV